MNLSISNIAWDKSEDAAVLAIMQQLGISGMDIAPTKLWDDPLAVDDAAIEQVKTRWESYDIHPIGMQSLIFGHPDLVVFGSAEARRELIEYLRGIIQLAGRLGITPLVFGSPKNRLVGEMPEKQAFAIAVDFFSELAEIAAGYQTILCLEPNAAAYGCDFIRTTAEALPLVQQINHPGLRLNLDTGIMTMNNEPVEQALEAAIEWVAHFHISEPQLVPIGEGGVDHPRFAHQLKHLGYDRWLAVEMRAVPLATIEKTLRYTLEAYS